MTTRLANYLIYPGTITLAIGLYASTSIAHGNVTIHAFASIITGLLLIAFFENIFPNRLSWRPRLSDAKTDLVYIALIQIAIPRLLGIAVALALAENTGPTSPLGWIWPREWPLAAQVALLIVSADFMRYWLHRFAHTVPLLWRLHAVHHSPDRLYWLNTSRFHPVEKVLHYSLDSLPFILMGVDPLVLGFWFVMYSVNGFFQHSNIDLRLGFLSSIFSTAEMHRWHHSRIPDESDANYANIFILWDRLFGSYFRPRDRNVAELGLLNSDYPMGFLEQCKAPLVAGLDKQAMPLPDAGGLLRNFLLRFGMNRIRDTLWKELMQVTDNPRLAQQKALQSILARNAATRYGEEHGFAQISSYEQFVQCLPVVTYEELRPYVEEQLQTGRPALTVEQPAMYNKTSGTTGQPKYVPVTPLELELRRRHGALLTFRQYAFDPLAFSGNVWAVASAAVEGRFENGVPWGSASGLLYASMPKIIADKYVLPPEVFEVANAELKYLLMLRLALAQKNITYLTCANPATLLKLRSLVNEHWAGLVSDIERGGFWRSEELPPHIMQATGRCLHAIPRRAAELRAIFERGQSATFADLWPFLRMVSTWTSGNCAVSAGNIRSILPVHARIVELGYLSSEFQGTITVDCETSVGLPALRDYFLEFIEPEQWDAGERKFLQLHQLETGRDYYIVITTPSGLYRYFMNDIVNISGKIGATPALRFRQKGKGVTSIVGEKLYESQVTEAVHRAERHFGLHTEFFMMLADMERNSYELLIEAGKETAPAAVLAHFIDAALSELNVEYCAKRDSDRLAPLRVGYLEHGTGDAYRTHCVEAGQKDGQYKSVVLQYAGECRFPFASCLSRS
jgi:sterol desaturase/sphingolipid hydroxylase (fatty acid hydroxylase superfamily)